MREAANGTISQIWKDPLVWETVLQKQEAGESAQSKSCRSDNSATKNSPSEIIFMVETKKNENPPCKDQGFVNQL